MPLFLPGRRGRQGASGNAAVTVGQWISAGTVSGGTGRPWFELGRQNGNVTGSIGYGVTLGRLYASPFVLARNGVITELAFCTEAAAAAGGVGRCGIYASDPDTMSPTALLLDAGEKTTNVASSIRKTTGLATALSKNTVYWYALLFGVQACNVVSYQFGRVFDMMGWADDPAVFNLSESVHNGIFIAQAYGALPANWPGGASTLVRVGGLPSVWARFSSVS